MCKVLQKCQSCCGLLNLTKQFKAKEAKTNSKNTIGVSLFYLRVYPGQWLCVTCYNIGCGHPYYHDIEAGKVPLSHYI